MVTIRNWTNAYIQVNDGVWIAPNSTIESTVSKDLYVPLASTIVQRDVMAKDYESEIGGETACVVHRSKGSYWILAVLTEQGSLCTNAFKKVQLMVNKTSPDILLDLFGTASPYSVMYEYSLNHIVTALHKLSAHHSGGLRPITLENVKSIQVNDFVKLESKWPIGTSSKKVVTGNITNIRFEYQPNSEVIYRVDVKVQDDDNEFEVSVPIGRIDGVGPEFDSGIKMYKL